MPDGTPLSRMDDLTTAVLVIDTAGDVQMANKHAHTMFAYKRGSLEGKPLAALLAPHYAPRLAKRLAALAAIHKDSVGEKEPEEPWDPLGELVVCLHPDRLAFQARLGLHKVAGVGEDSTVVAIVELVQPAKGMASLWVTQGGLITACDASFVAHFGWKPSEITGANVQVLVSCIAPSAGTGAAACGSDSCSREQKGTPPNTSGTAGSSAGGVNTLIMARLLSGAKSASDAAAAAAVEGGGTAGVSASDRPGSSGPLSCRLPHKYLRTPLACEILLVGHVGSPVNSTAPTAGTEHAAASTAAATTTVTATVYELKIKVLSEPAQLLTLNRKGAILHASPELVPLLIHGEHDSSEHHLVVLNGGRQGGMPSGRGGNLAAGPTHDSLADFTISDFLSPAWRDLHTKLIRDVAVPASSTPASAGQLQSSCRKSAQPGATLEMRTANGKELFMRVGVSTKEVQGEMIHVVQLERSTLDAALAERRLRLRLSPDGLISAVETGNPLQLFGLETASIVGRGLWEILDGLPLMAGDVPGTAGPAAVTKFIDRSLAYPGYSWRVQVLQPRLRSVGSGCDRPMRAQNPKPAIIQIEPSAGEDTAEASLGNDADGVLVDLWPAASIIGILELDTFGRIRAVLEERSRPAGLLFGLPSQSLVGSMLSEFLTLPSGFSNPGDLLHASFKKSSLRSRSRDASIKVGPVHVLRASHQQGGSPLSLDVQVVGKPGSNEHMTAILRVHPTPLVPPKTSILSSSSRTAAAVLDAASSLRTPAALPPAKVAAGGPAVGGPHSTAAVAGAGAAAAAAGDERATGVVAAPARKDSAITLAAELSLRDQPPPASPQAAVDAGSERLLAAAPNRDEELLLDTRKTAYSLRLPSPSPSAGPAASGEADPSNRSPMTAELPPLLSPQQPLAGINRPLTPSAAGPMQDAPAAASNLQNLAGIDKLAQMVQSIGEDKLAAGGRGLVAYPPRPSFHACPRPRSRTASNGQQAAVTASFVQEPATPDSKQSDLIGPAEIPGTVSPATVPPSLRTKMEMLPLDDIESDPALDGVQDKDDETSLDKIYKWVATKGAYYQNSDPGAVHGGRSSGSPALLNFDHEGDGAEGAQVSERRSPIAKSPRSKTATDGPNGGDIVPLTASAATIATRPEESEGGSAGSDRARPEAPGTSEDAASDGGRSEGGASESQSASGSEYTRGKRVRKLAKLMDSSEAKKVQKRLRTHTQTIVMLLAMAHIVCFALTVMTVKSQRTSMLQLGRSALALLDMHKVMINVRTLDNIATGRWHPNFYTPADAAYIVHDIGIHAEEAMMLLNGILGKHSSSSEVFTLLYQSKQPVWDSKDAKGEDVYTNITILDFGTRFYAMAKSVEQNHDTWVKTGTRIANTPPGQFLIKSGPNFYKEFTKVMTALLSELVKSSRHVEQEQVVFLVVEGAVLSCIAACYLAYLLRTVAAQRCKLYSTFLAIPLGLTRALASQSTNLVLDEDDDSEVDDDEEDKALSGLDADAQSDDARQKLRRRAKLKVQDAEEPPSPRAWDGVKGGRLTGRPPPGIASAAAAVGSLSVRAGADDREVFRINSKTRFAGDDAAKTADMAAVGCWGWFMMIMRRRLLWRSLSSSLGSLSVRLAKRVNIHSTPQYFAASGGPSSSFSEYGSRRKLVVDSHETTMMMISFIFWSILVMTIYSVAVVRLKGVAEVVALHSVANFMATRTARTVFYSQELMSVESALDLHDKRANLVDATKLVRDIWFTLQLGSDAYLSSGNDTETFPMVTSGLANSSPELLQQLYTTGSCHRLEENLPCPDSTHRFHKMAYGSLASVVQQHMMSLKALATNTSDVPPSGLQDDDFDFIYNIGYKDLLDGAILLKDAHAETIVAKFNTIMILHIVLFLLFWAIFAVFLSLQLNPLLRRFAEERRRVAELLAQLPLELDVEKLVVRALGTSGTGSFGSTTRTSQGGSGGGGDVAFNTSMGDGAPNDHPEGGGGISKWKAIIRASSSLNKKGTSSDRKK
ncbi:hypothetical protein PLESTM_001299600 [Pleodorina starrii]|nr:hypothetical protein PLESTM_001299600 [Pleodorina starrii]